jgi:putative phosphotransacetylase
MKRSVITNISNRHIHLTQEHVDILFGKNHCLKKTKDLMQPGEHACEETVTIKGPKGEIPRVRVLGPIRKNTQVEVSIGDTIKLGIEAHIRLSGDLAGSAPITVISPTASIDLKEGCIVAKRHVHMSDAQAAEYGVKNQDIVSIKAGTEREVIFNNVVARVSPNMTLECHLDIEEANAAGIKNGTIAEIVLVNGK